MSEDYLGLGEIAGKRSQPAFIVGDKAASDEVLRLMERMHRVGGAKYPGALDPIFTIVDEDSGEEVLDEGEADRWQARMGWPRQPSLAEVEAFKLNRLATMRAAYWRLFAALDTATA